jgi:deazaflavin-dependent oxidoreductase (nitroreductase family)
MPPARLLRRLLRAPAALYRWRCGWLLGHRFLLLIHTGRRTGRRHETVLEVMEFRPASQEAVVMSGWGSQANWLRNIQSAAAPPEITIGTRHFAASHRRLGVPEAVTVIAAYERRHRLITPILRAVLSRLAGWRYDGSDPARHRLAQELPLVAFRPLQGSRLTIT